MSDPITNGANGGDHDDAGRFKPGNQAARGRTHPLARLAVERAAAFRGAVRPDDVAELAGVLLKAALAGDLGAARLVLDFAVGSASEHDIDARIAALEERHGR